MAEDFPHYQHEDSDDDVPVERAPEAPHAPAHEQTPPAPVGQEGTIFSRDTIAPTLSRPLFDFIRNQEQPKAQPEAADETAAAPEELPSVTTPAEPEMRTYQPPAEAEAAQAAHAAKEAAAETDDDDDETAAEDAEPPAVVPPPSPQTTPLPHAEQAPRNLNEQFEEIMRQEMDEDFAALTSDEQLGIDEKTPAPAGTTPEPRHFVPDRQPVPLPTAAEMPASAAPEASIDTLPEAPPLPAESPAFYYAEDAPGSTDPLPPVPPKTGGPTTTTTHPLIAGSPPPPPIHGGSGGGGGGGGGGPFGMPSGGFNMAPNFAPVATLNPLEAAVPVARQEKPHHGRWFVAGFITGWVVKQHFANKKLRAQQAAHEKTIEAQNEKLDTAAYNQYHTEQRLKRTELQLQQTQTEQAEGQRAAKEAENARLNQEQRERFMAAERPPAAPEGVPLAVAAAPLAAERPARPAPAMEMPLQYAAAAEAPFAAVAAAAAPGAERQRPAAFANETAPKPAPERPPKTPTEEAEEAVAQAYGLEQGQHIERATGGGHDIVVDRHGHEVQNARVYGKEFQNQKRQEQLKVDVFATGDTNAADALKTRKSSGMPDYGSGIITGLGGGGGGLVGSGQTDAGHSLPAGPPSPASQQHLLPSKRQNPVVATLTSPWLWASVVVLIAAFFIAAFS